MKPYHKPLLTLILLFCSLILFAQDKNASMALVKEGTALHDARKYDEAIAKYDEALKIDPGNLTAQFEKGFSLATSGKTDLAIPILEKVAATNTQPSAYDVLGSIYDDKQDFEKATKYYTQGIAAFPKYQMLHYNLSISLFRQKKFAEAEAAAIDAIKLNPRHPSSQRGYALITYAEGKHEVSLMAWCSFLMLEAKTQRSTEANAFIKNILNNSIKKGTNGADGIVLRDGSPEAKQQQMEIAMAVNVANPTFANGVTPPTKSAVDSLSSDLSMVFKLIGAKPEKFGSPFVTKYFVDYFKAMNESQNMSALTHYITLSVYNAEDVTWFQSHPKEFKDFADWLKATKRETE